MSQSQEISENFKKYAKLKQLVSLHCLIFHQSAHARIHTHKHLALIPSPYTIPHKLPLLLYFLQTEKNWNAEQIFNEY